MRYMYYPLRRICTVQSTDFCALQVSRQVVRAVRKEDTEQA